MKSIYFSNKTSSYSFLSPSQILKTITCVASHSFVKISPSFSQYLGLKILCNPFSKRDYKFDTNLTPRSHSIRYGDQGDIKAYHFEGGEKTVVLSHGWSDNSSTFSDLINFLVESGYSVWTFDHVGHGKSLGSTAHLFAFINGLKSVLSYIEENGHKIEALIGHSMGAVALMNLDKSYLETRKTVFIATPMNFFEIMFERITKAGLSSTFLTNLLEGVSKRHNTNWQNLKPYNQLNKHGQNTIFIHDEKDRYAPFYHVKVAQEYTNFNLISTSGLGHARILRSEEIKGIIREHLY